MLFGSIWSLLNCSLKQAVIDWLQVAVVHLCIIILEPALVKRKIQVGRRYHSPVLECDSSRLESSLLESSLLESSRLEL